MPTVESIKNALSRPAGLFAQKLGHTLDGSGAQTDNIFTVTGHVRILGLLMTVETVTDATTVSACSFKLYDGTNTVVISEAATGVDLSSTVAGSLVYVGGPATDAAIHMKGDQIRLGADDLESFLISPKNGATSYIRFCFTGDSATDVDVDFTVFYERLSPDAVIASV